MSTNTELIREIYTSHFNEIYQRCTPELMMDLNSKLEPFREQISVEFYQAMITVKGSEGLLTNQLVQERLQTALSQWVKDLFIMRNIDELEVYIDYQLNIGQVHARINLAPHLFNCGVRVLKQQVNYILRKDEISLKEYNSLSTLAMMLIDLSTSLMNESFFGDIVVGERKSQSLQMQMSGSELALKCEQLRAETFSWFTRVLGILRENNIVKGQSVPLCSHSEVGLWINHKATLFFPSSTHVKQIQDKLIVIDELINRIVEIEQSDTVKFNSALNALEAEVKSISSILSGLAEQSTSMDSGRDPLTRLFNRRYLETVLQKESHFCMIHNKSYVLLLLDIDHFKQVNDTYGHDAGDRVLEQMGELLSHDIHAGDFVFRYGGEEFLILLADMKLEFVSNIAEKLLNTVRNHEFNIDRNEPLNCRISIGIASHQGQPDYNRVITNADIALYKAKESGRDKYVIFNEH